MAVTTLHNTYGVGVVQFMFDKPLHCPAFGFSAAYRVI